MDRVELLQCQWEHIPYKWADHRSHHAQSSCIVYIVFKHLYSASSGVNRSEAHSSWTMFVAWKKVWVVTLASTYPNAAK